MTVNLALKVMTAYTKPYFSFDFNRHFVGFLFSHVRCYCLRAQSSLKNTVNLTSPLPFKLVQLKSKTASGAVYREDSSS